MIWGWAERRFVFTPQPGLAGTPADAGLRYEDVYLTTSDGLTLHAWFVPAPKKLTGPNTQTWLWFHGNGGNLGTRVGQLEWTRRNLGVHQFIFDYRGFGNSHGQPTERGTYLDARAALEYLRNRPEINAQHIVYFGHSLGAAVSIELATAHAPFGIVLIAPFASIRDMAPLVVPFPALGWFVRGHYNSLQRIAKVQAPLLLLHGDEDEIVPYEQGERLYHTANRPKRLVTLHGASHDVIPPAAEKELASALVEFRDAIEFGDVAPGYTPLTISL